MNFLVVVSHQVKPGFQHEALKRILDNGERMSNFAGFGQRTVAIEEREGDELLTVTYWRSKQDFLAWEDALARSRPDESVSPFVVPPKKRFYHTTEG